MVQVNPSSSVFSVAVNSTNAANQVGVGRSQSYYDGLAREWAISPNIVQNEDYSSKYYAGKSKEYADSILQDAGFIAVSQDLTNIDTVANSIANVNTVAMDISNVNAVYTDLSNIDSVAGDLTNIDSVASDLTNINAVNSNKTNIDTVAGSISNVNAVATSISNVNAVYADLTNVDTVAGSITNVNNVGGSITNVNTVATNVSDINTCSTNISDINTCAANISTIETKVNKTGDIMTGNLQIWNTSHSSSNYPTFSGLNFLYDISATTSSDTTRALNLSALDKYSELAGEFYTLHDSTNYMKSGFAVYRKVNGSTKSAKFELELDTNGNKSVYATPEIKQIMTNWGSPSNTYETIVIQASGSSYIAPYDGWFCANLCFYTGGAMGACSFGNSTRGNMTVTISGGDGEWFADILPVNKGDYVMFNYYNCSFSSGTISWQKKNGGIS